MLGLGLSLSLGQQFRFSPVSLFAGGTKGLIWDFSNPSSLYSDAGITPAVLNGAIGRVMDQSPNGNNGNQTTAANKPLWKSSGGKFFALFDGVNDGFSTSAIDLSGAAAVTMFIGVTKLSDAARSSILEFSTGGQAGSFGLEGPGGAGLHNYDFFSKGTAGVDNTVTTYTAPVTNVITGLASIAAPSNIIRVNGAQIGSPIVTTQGTGNYGNYALYVAGRAGTSLPFNGQIFCLIIVGRTCTAAEIAATEAWVNARTGAY